MKVWGIDIDNAYLEGVRSTQIPFLMCTLEIPQKITVQVLALNFALFALLLSFSLNYELLSFTFIFVLLSII